MTIEFTNAAHEAAGTAKIAEQTKLRKPSPTYPASAGGAGQDPSVHHPTPASSDTSPSGERDVPAKTRDPSEDSTSRDNPAATPGEQAMIPKQTVVEKPVPTNPPCGAGDDAIGVEKPRQAKHHPTHPASAGGGGQRRRETHTATAVAQKPRRKAGKIDSDHAMPETQTFAETVDLRFTDPLVAEIVQLHRHRRRWMKARTALTLQCMAHARAMLDGDKDAASDAFARIYKVFTEQKSAGLKAGDDDLLVLMLPYLAGIQRLEQEEVLYLKRMVKLTMKLPIAPFIKGTKGLGEPSAATIIGEAGDLSKYPSIAGVWKRLGLAVIDGGRQRRVSDPELALLHGYDAKRRSIVWNAGNNLIGGMGVGRRPLDGEDVDLREDWTPYEKLCVHRLRYEAEKDPSHRRPNTKEGKESYSKHAAARAKRYVEKRMLKDMTLAWRRAVGQSECAAQEVPADRPTFLEAAE